MLRVRAHRASNRRILWADSQFVFRAVGKLEITADAFILLLEARQLDPAHKHKIDHFMHDQFGKNEKACGPRRLLLVTIRPPRIDRLHSFGFAVSKRCVVFAGIRVRWREFWGQAAEAARFGRRLKGQTRRNLGRLGFLKFYRDDSSANPVNCRP